MSLKSSKDNGKVELVATAVERERFEGVKAWWDARHASTSRRFDQFGHKTRAKTHFEERARAFGGMDYKTTLGGGFLGLGLKTGCRAGTVEV